MKCFFTLVFLVITYNAFSQEEFKTAGFYYKVSLATTLTINEDYTIGNDDDEVLINPSAFFINNTVGLQLNETLSVGLNMEYDWHSKSGLHFLPVYFSTKYNIVEDEENFFIRGGYGLIINPNNNFEKGSLYKVGLGFQLFDENYKNSWLVGLDFSRKRFGYNQQEKLSSVSVFVEFMLF